MKSGERLIFIGDSITDCGRNTDSEKIGDGYVRIIRDHLRLRQPEGIPDIINKGISGNRITDLADRWEKDVLALNPDYVSISIGINDVWRQLDNPDMNQVYPGEFEQVYQKLLSLVKVNTNARIIIMEPTIIEENIESEGNRKLQPYVDIVRRLAVMFNGVLVPEHQSFKNVLKQHPDYKLTTDGVHMNSTGNLLMARTWLRANGLEE